MAPGSLIQMRIFGSLKLQNTITAYSLGMDTKGTHYGWMLLSTREQAAGIPIAIPYKIRSRSANKDKIVTESTKVIPSLIQQVIDVYEKCGKHSKKWNTAIAEIHFDSDPIFKSDATKAILRDNKINGIWSPIGQKELNGLAEVNNKLISNKVATFYAEAPHVPEQLWWRAALLACAVMRCYQSLIPGSLKNRMQELSNEEMRWDLLAIHPWGQPMEYFYDISRRTGGIKEHSRTGCYVGPDYDTPGNVMLLNFDTGRVISAKKYVILHDIPIKWTQQDLSKFVIDDSPEPVITDDDTTSIRTESSPLTEAPVTAFPDSSITPRVSEMILLP